MKAYLVNSKENLILKKIKLRLMNYNFRLIKKMTKLNHSTVIN
jgi:hypothetical protein